MALDTVQDYVDECRVLLQDSVIPYRYTTDQLVQGLNLALLEARKLRPDLFLSWNWIIPAYSSGNLAESVTIEPMYRGAFIYYMVGRAQLRDDETTQDQRAVAFMSMFRSQLLVTAA